MAGAGELPDNVAQLLNAAGLRRSMSLPAEKAKLAAMLRNFADSAPAVIIEADSPAYLAFTSGSTGEPKGVLCRHGPMTHFLRWPEEAFGLHSSDRYALLSGLAYNHLHRDLFTALASGRRYSFQIPDCLKDPNRLADWLREACDHYSPSHARARPNARNRQRQKPAVRAPDIFRRRSAVAPGCPVDARARAERRNREFLRRHGNPARSGLFRCVGRSATGRCSRASRRCRRGRGAPDVQLLLLTPSGQLAGVGEVGELYVRSPHLAAGYVDDDALTAANFLVNPFTREKSDRLVSYRRSRSVFAGRQCRVGRPARPAASIRGFRGRTRRSGSGAAPMRRRARMPPWSPMNFVSGRAERKDTRLIAYLEIDFASAVQY